jgi:hypothetical protein
MGISLIRGLEREALEDGLKTWMRPQVFEERYDLDIEQGGIVGGHASL